MLSYCKFVIDFTLYLLLFIVFAINHESPFTVFTSHDIVLLKIRDAHPNFRARSPWKRTKMCFLQFLTKVSTLGYMFINKSHINVLILHLLSIIIAL